MMTYEAQFNSPSRALWPIGRCWSLFPKALSQTPVFTLRDHGYGASVSRGVPVNIPTVKPVPNYTAWWQRHNLSKVVTRQCPGAESNLRLWVTSGLQDRHVTVRLPSHRSGWLSWNPNWKPVQLFQHQRFVVVASSTRHQPCSCILHRLQLTHQTICDAVEHRVAVVQATWNKRLDQCLDGVRWHQSDEPFNRSFFYWL